MKSMDKSHQLRRRKAPPATFLRKMRAFGVDALACASFVFLTAADAPAVTIRSKSDMRLWETVSSRSIPLSWQWEEAADSAELVFSNRLTCVVSTVNVSRALDETHGGCAHPSQNGETIVDVSLVQKAGGAEVVRETATLAYFDGAGGGPITVRANPGTRGWERVQSPRVYAIDPAWQGEGGESGYDIAWPMNIGLTIIFR